MYLLESVENKVFIFRVREAQKRSTGFTSKIRWSLQVRGEKYNYKRGGCDFGENCLFFFLYATL